MAVEYAIFDLWHLLVELTFGNFLITIIAIGVIYGVLCSMFRMGLTLTIAIIVIFYLTMGVGYYGSIAGILVGTASFGYFGYSVYRWVTGGQQ